MGGCNDASAFKALRIEGKVNWVADILPQV